MSILNAVAVRSARLDVPGAILARPRAQPAAVARRMPIRIAPLTRQACSTAISTRPMIATAAVGVVRSPRATVVAGWATMIPASFRPMKAMNSPTPAATAENSGLGIAATIIWRTPTRVSTRKATPDRKTQPRAVSHGTPMPLTTV